MKITDASWSRYLATLRQLNKDAYLAMNFYMIKHSDYYQKVGSSYKLNAQQRRELIDYAYAVATKYGEGATAAACEMYDAIALVSNAKVPPAMPAPTATYDEVAKAVNGTLKQGAEVVPESVSRLVKLAGVDTTMSNAIRDGAYYAWIPRGDTCAFCLMLASQGWKPASPTDMEGDHAAHIHANCDCTYAVRFGNNLNVEGYNPRQYLAMYNNAPGRTWQDKLNSMRRDFYQENKDEINAQKRSAYAKRVERNSSAAEEINIE